jgi:hypothetical protein
MCGLWSSLVDLTHSAQTSAEWRSESLIAEVPVGQQEASTYPGRAWVFRM